jgi:hypothetical protein
MPRYRWSPADGQRGWHAGDPMTSAELTAAREFLGLTGRWIAEVADVDDRNQRRWAAGVQTIPPHAQYLIEGLEELAGNAVTHLAEYLKLVTDRGVVLLRDDADYQAAAPAGTVAMPARWHHHVAARTNLLFPELMLAFAGEPAPSGNWLHMVVSVADLRTGLDEVTYTMQRTNQAQVS